jgi:hypothetical protein
MTKIRRKDGMNESMCSDCPVPVEVRRNTRCCERCTPENPAREKPEGAVKWGKCARCEEEDWLFKSEAEDLMCEACIDEFHDDVHDAEDAMSLLS